MKKPTLKTQITSKKPVIKERPSKITPSLKKFNEKMINKKGNKTGPLDTSKWGA